MPRKKTAQVEKPVEELVFEDEIDEQEEENHRNGGLDLFDADGELIEEGEPTYIEDEEEEEE